LNAFDVSLRPASACGRAARGERRRAMRDGIEAIKRESEERLKKKIKY